MNRLPIIPLDEIKACLRDDDILSAVKEALISHGRGDVNSPPPGILQLDHPAVGECHIKYGNQKGADTFVVKVASGFRDNGKLGLSPNSGLMLVLSAQTGAPVCVLDDKGWLTDIRTAAAGALAAQVGAPDKVTAVGIIGTGEQARLQAHWTCRLLGVKSVVVYGRNPEQVAQYVDDMTTQGYDVSIASEIKHLLGQCNLIITTTPSSKALVLKDDVQPGTHIVAMGTDNPGKQELDPALFAQARGIMVDDLAQCVHHGDLGHAVREGLISQDRAVSLGLVLAGEKPGRLNADDITIADLTGIAAQDIAVASLVWEQRRGG
ncbi:ornithine cyclodeaminase [Kiloniella litopenaei]|uniref:Ornithine cyclodeaminase n=1 Tax=Kiloniella litopenaei TaxID=1549748 RepID=A0A0M2RAP9_9PROT|nr:ornithine cyclodeaminase [Kiloniella litopenaei]KKJ78721.1 ornithine cyclodeaminase [Kiloniella litopenaei]